MSRLVWETIGLGVIEAWHRDDGTSARCVLRIEGTARPRITARRPIVDVEPPIVLSLAHSEFDVERAKRLAEMIEAEYPITANDERVLQELLDAHRLQQLEAHPVRRELRCEFVHAWRPNARDSEVCHCGRLTKAFARERGLAVPA